MRYILIAVMAVMSLFMVNSVISSEQDDPLDIIQGYWTTNKWGEHRLCIFVPPMKEGDSQKCFPVPDRVFRQVAA